MDETREQRQLINLLYHYGNLDAATDVAVSLSPDGADGTTLLTRHVHAGSDPGKLSEDLATPLDAGTAMDLAESNPGWAPTLFSYTFGSRALLAALDSLGVYQPDTAKVITAVLDAALRDGTHLSGFDVVDVLNNLAPRLVRCAATNEGCVGAFRAAVSLLDAAVCESAALDTVKRFDSATATAAVYAYTTSPELRRCCERKLVFMLSHPRDVASFVVPDLTDVLCDRIDEIRMSALDGATATPTLREGLSRIEKIVEGCCENFTYLMVPQRPRIAVRAADASWVCGSDLYGSFANIARFTLDMYVGPKGDTQRFADAVSDAASRDPERIDAVFTRVTANGKLNNDPDVETLLLRMLAMNANTSESTLLRVALEGENSSALADAFEAREHIPSAVVFALAGRSTTWLSLLAKCDNVPAAAASWFNTQTISPTLSPGMLVEDLSRAGVWKRVDVASLNALAALGSTQGIGERTTYVGHDVDRIGNWCAQHLFTTPTRTRFVLEMVREHVGTLGELKALADTAT